MSTIEILYAQFPQAVPHSISVGQEIALSIVGRVTAIEEDMIDVTPMGGKPVYTPGQRRTTIMLTSVEAKR